MRIWSPESFFWGLNLSYFLQSNPFNLHLCREGGGGQTRIRLQSEKDEDLTLYTRCLAKKSVKKEKKSRNLRKDTIHSADVSDRVEGRQGLLPYEGFVSDLQQAKLRYSSQDLEHDLLIPSYSVLYEEGLRGKGGGRSL